MSGIYSMSGPTYRGATRQEMFDAAMEQPLSITSTLLDQAKGGVLESFGLGTALREAQLPEAAPVVPGITADPGERDFLKSRWETPQELGTRRQSMGAYDEDQYKASPYFRKDIPYDPGMTEARASALASMDDAKKVRQFYAQKRPFSAFIGNLAGQAFDPINYVPVAGPLVKAAAVAKAGRIGGGAIHAGLDAAANTAAFGIATSGERAKFGDDVSWQATVSQIATAALIGSAFGAIGGAVGSRVDARVKAEAESRLATLKTTQEARIALNEGIDALVRGEDIRLSPNATEPMARVADEIATNQPPKAVVGVEPPVQDGFVRIYHSGSVGEGETGRWVSTNRQYAADYRGDLPLHYLDIPADDPRINNADIPEQGVKEGFTFIFETTPKEAAQLKEISRDKPPADLLSSGEPLAKADTAKTIPNDSSLNRTASWVLRDKETKAVVMETFDAKMVGRLNTEKYEAVPIGQYLGEINGKPKTAPAIDTTAARPDVAPEGIKQAEAAVAKPDDAKALAAQYRVDPQTGSFAEEAEVAQLAAEGRLTAEDANTMAQAQSDFETGASYAEALKSVAGCLL
ncbi:hypothetical protein LRP31_25430 [Mesorhizobium mediterraneum]|uniref:Uncharacterized protein n=1 Tax=Mesorhizobium mediterraneum TaxID=43617 RepID=A0AB36R7V8_9HYPH|nr:hypothetical protein [Mesorhizobium mediterraneum]PAQ00901.1 hypothetical protein CIT25_17700 [Mesorhizobium mediterraneum]WIW52364.1 hypothetical protein LRP31_25430 [Mesorhizobium mediterraneum]